MTRLRAPPIGLEREQVPYKIKNQLRDVSTVRGDCHDDLNVVMGLSPVITHE